jgi:hypothetical protein
MSLPYTTSQNKHRAKYIKIGVYFLTKGISLDVAMASRNYIEKLVWYLIDRTGQLQLHAVPP